MRIFLILAILSITLAANTTTKTLVILDNKNLEQTHKKFFSQLEEFGPVTFAYTFQKEIKLTYYDEYLYDQLVVMSTSEKCKPVKPRRN